MFIFPANIIQNRRIVKRCSFYIQLKWSQLRPMLIFYTPWKHQKTTGGAREDIDQKWVKQQQHRQERHNLMLLTWNVKSLFEKQNDCKNTATWLTQTAQSFILCHQHWRSKIIFWKIIFSFKTCFVLKFLATKSFLNLRKMWN